MHCKQRGSAAFNVCVFGVGVYTQVLPRKLRCSQAKCEEGLCEAGRQTLREIKKFSLDYYVFTSCFVLLAENRAGLAKRRVFSVGVQVLSNQGPKAMNRV